MKLKSRFIFVLFAVLLTSSIAYGCTCELPSTRRAFNGSKYVFQGKVIAVKENDITFEIEKSWKGNLKKQVSVDAEPNAFTGSCGDGFAFELNETYVVFIRGSDLITINSCTNNFHITPTPNPAKFDKPIDHQKRVLGKLNSSFFRFWSSIYPF